MVSERVVVILVRSIQGRKRSQVPVCCFAREIRYLIHKNASAPNKSPRSNKV